MRRRKWTAEEEAYSLAAQQERNRQQARAAHDIKRGLEIEPLIENLRNIQTRWNDGELQAYTYVAEVADAVDALLRKWDK